MVHPCLTVSKTTPANKPVQRKQSCIPAFSRSIVTTANTSLCHRVHARLWAKALEHVAADHEAFVLEVDRIMLAKDGSLLALFRTVGTSDSDKGLCEPGVLSDRASAEMDPMTALRTDVLYVFLEKKLSHVQRKDELDLAAVHEHPKLLRQATIVRTVGGSAHGYVHCSLSRLALGPELTKKQLDLKHLHRICRRHTNKVTSFSTCQFNRALALAPARSWTAKLAGRRMAPRRLGAHILLLDVAVVLSLHMQSHAVPCSASSMQASG